MSERGFSRDCGISRIVYGEETGSKGEFIINGRVQDKYELGKSSMTIFIRYTRYVLSQWMIHIDTYQGGTVVCLLNETHTIPPDLITDRTDRC